MRFAPRRRLCRAMFCTICLLPTLLIGSAAIVVMSPAYRTARQTRWQALLAARLGLEVAVDSIDWDRDGELVAHAIELRDPESHKCLARARSATLMLSDSGPIIRLGQLEIDSSRLPRLAEVLHEHLLLRSATTWSSLQVTTPTLVLADEARSESLLDVRLVLQAGDDAAEALCEFRPTGSEEGERVRLRVVRNRQIDPPATGWELHTGTSGLPCQWASAWLPQVVQLGDTCSFQGSIWSERLSSGWEGRISGVFRQLDLDRLVTGRFPHKLSGFAEVAITRMIWRHDQLVQANGQLCSVGGVVSQTLVKSAEKHLGMKRYAPSSEAMLLRYSDLAFGFSLDKTGLTIVGRIDQDLTVLADDQGPLLSSKDAPRVAPQAFVQLLVPLADLQVPAAEEAVALLRILPLPTVNPGTTTSARREYSPLQLRRE